MRDFIYRFIAKGAAAFMLMFSLSVPCAPAFADYTPRDPSGKSKHEKEIRVELDLNALSSRIQETPAIGLFTKLDLKNQFGKLLDDINIYHEGKRNQSMEELRQRFNSLFYRTLMLLQNADPILFRELAVACDAIWYALNDERK